MPTSPSDPLSQAQRDLAAWHATHPDATLAEIEAAVETQLDRVRVQLLAERTTPRAGEDHPLCVKCGATMESRARTARQVLFRGDQPLELERDYVVCPQCGAGLFPPG
jgi:ribosomal protein S27AE